MTRASILLRTPTVLAPWGIVSPTHGASTRRTDRALAARGPRATVPTRGSRTDILAGPSRTDGDLLLFLRPGRHGKARCASGRIRLLDATSPGSHVWRFA